MLGWISTCECISNSSLSDSALLKTYRTNINPIKDYVGAAVFVAKILTGKLPAYSVQMCMQNKTSAKRCSWKLFTSAAKTTNKKVMGSNWAAVLDCQREGHILFNCQLLLQFVRFLCFVCFFSFYRLVKLSTKLMNHIRFASRIRQMSLSAA